MSYELGDGDGGQVENESYCLKKSFNARNVDSMTQQMGYKNLSDLANTPKPNTPATGEKRNTQLGPKSADSSMNDRKGKAY